MTDRPMSTGSRTLRKNRMAKSQNRLVTLSGSLVFFLFCLVCYVPVVQISKTKLTKNSTSGPLTLHTRVDSR